MKQSTRDLIVTETDLIFGQLFAEPFPGAADAAQTLAWKAASRIGQRIGAHVLVNVVWLGSTDLLDFRWCVDGEPTRYTPIIRTHDPSQRLGHVRRTGVARTALREWFTQKAMAELSRVNPLPPRTGITIDESGTPMTDADV